MLSHGGSGAIPARSSGLLERELGGTGPTLRYAAARPAFRGEAVGRWTSIACVGRRVIFFAP